MKKRNLPAALKIPRPTPWRPPVEEQAPRQPQPQPARAGRRHAQTVAEVVAVLAHGFRR